jgi:hypothetical protein
MLEATHPNRLRPAAAVVRNSISPTVQVAGMVLAVFSGFVVMAAEKSTFLL